MINFLSFRFPIAVRYVTTKHIVSGVQVQSIHYWSVLVSTYLSNPDELKQNRTAKTPTKEPRIPFQSSNNLQYIVKRPPLLFF